ncbi:hypothetical protein GCM10010174_80560 [Kutzneria viridogrisea]|uniref:Uncharacterized protein n=1 Tax=Kutzneria viridogrisea TaxID=47990 RepID=A0ABR6BZJ0_9PSEU|nr:hypothetical protein [Kutzneria viridogrisea]
MDTPRVLTLTFKLQVPSGLRANIHFPRIESAIAAFTGAVQGLAGTVFPWADRLQVQQSWSYEWFATTTDIDLPQTAKNTVAPKAEPAADAEVEATTAGERA